MGIQELSKTNDFRKLGQLNVGVRIPIAYFILAKKKSLKPVLGSLLHFASIVSVSLAKTSNDIEGLPPLGRASLGIAEHCVAQLNPIEFIAQELYQGIFLEDNHLFSGTSPLVSSDSKMIEYISDEGALPDIEQRPFRLEF